MPIEYSIDYRRRLVLGKAIGRLYQANRDSEDRGTKQVAVFRSREEAFAFF